MSRTPFDYVKSINGKTGRITDFEDKEYIPFIINKVFSNTKDSIMYANEANTFTSMVTPQMAYDFYYYGLPKSSRFGKWHKAKKNDKATQEVIEYVMDYFNITSVKAIDIIADFDDDVIKSIKDDIKLMNNMVKKVKA